MKKVDKLLPVVNRSGREWDSLFDHAVIQSLLPDHCNYQVITEDGQPICGSQGHIGNTIVYVATGWSLKRI